jgi:hypothetical protein
MVGGDPWQLAVDPDLTDVSRSAVKPGILFFPTARKQTMSILHSAFNLDGGVADAEVPVQIGRNLLKELITGFGFRYHQVSRQGGFGCTHGPDMQIVDRNDTRK